MVVLSRQWRGSIFSATAVTRPRRSIGHDKDVDKVILINRRLQRHRRRHRPRTRGRPARNLCSAHAAPTGWRRSRRGNPRQAAARCSSAPLGRHPPRRASPPLPRRRSEAWGRVDAIVNNAGVMPLSLMASLKVEEWDRMVDVNIKGVLYGIAAVLPEMTARGAGHIINIASIGALQVLADGRRLLRDQICGAGDLRRAAPGERQYPRHLHPSRRRRERACRHDHRSGRRRGDEDLSRHRPQPDAIGRAVRFAIEQPDDVDVNEIVVRPIATR